MKKSILDITLKDALTILKEKFTDFDSKRHQWYIDRVQSKNKVFVGCIDNNGDIIYEFVFEYIPDSSISKELVLIYENKHCLKQLDLDLAIISDELGYNIPQLNRFVQKIK